MSEELELMLAERAIQRVLTSYDWRRTDPAGTGGGFADTYVRGIRSADDIVYHILDQ
jgi:hypothetical protein